MHCYALYIIPLFVTFRLPLRKFYYLRAPLNFVLVLCVYIREKRRGRSGSAWKGRMNEDVIALLGSVWDLGMRIYSIGAQFFISSRESPQVI